MKPGTHRAIRNERIRKIVEAAARQGWDVYYDGRGHVQVRHPSGNGKFWVSASANDKAMGHHYENTKALARRAGLDVRGL